MGKQILFRGVGTAMVTPMREDGTINYPVFGQLLREQADRGADAVIIAGTTGEGSTLYDQGAYRTGGICCEKDQRKNSGHRRCGKQ